MLEYFMDGQAARAPEASFEWASSAGIYLGSDNLDSASCYAVVRTTTGRILNPGDLCVMTFVADGGVPAPGDPVYVASSQSDGNTGRSKATKTVPPLLPMPAFPLFTQNIVPGAICVSSGAFPKCLVRVTGPIVPTQPLPVNSSSTLQRTHFPAASSLRSPGQPAQMQLLDQQTVIFYMTVDELNATIAGFTFSGNIGLVSGLAWGILSENNGNVTTDLYNSSVAIVPAPQPVPGLWTVAITHTGGRLRMATNGNGVVSVADTGFLTGADAVFQLGLSASYASSTGVIKLNRVMLDAELMSVTDPNQRVETDASRYAPPAALRADPTCQWGMDLTGYVGPGAPLAFAGPAVIGAAPVFTLTGVPAQRSLVLNWNRNLNPLFLDGPAPTYDSKHLSRTRQGMDIEFTTPDIFGAAVVIQEIVDDNSDDADEGNDTLFMKDSTPGRAWFPISVSGSPPDGMPYKQSFAALTAGGGAPFANWLANVGDTPPYHTMLVVPERVNYIDTFDGGTSIASLVLPGSATFATDAAAVRRLAACGEAVTLMGHGNDLENGSPASGGVLSHVRETYPGRVSLPFTVPNQTVAALKRWGGGSMVPAATYNFDMAQAGGLPFYLFFLGFIDWYSSAEFAAQFQVDYQALLVATRALDAVRPICLARLVQTPLFATPNANLELLGAFDTAIVNIAGALPYVNLLDLTGPNPLTFAGGGTGGAPTATGSVNLALNMKSNGVIGWP